MAVGISVTVIMLSALLFDRLKLPHILGVLVAGILIGPFSPLAGVTLFGMHFQNVIISDPSIVSIFAVIGSALILFGIGLEFSIIKLWKMGLFTFLAAVIKIGIVYLVSYFLLSILGFSAAASALVSLALSFSSTPIIIKLLEDSGKIKRPEASFIISVLVIEDLLIVFFLGILSHTTAGEGGYFFLVSILRVVLTFIFAYLVLSRMINYFLKLVSHSDELTILSTVSFVLVVGYISEYIGLSFSVGAFLAGSTIAGSQYSRRIEEKIKPFNSLFSSFFFFSIGLMVNINGVLANPLVVPLFIFIGLIVRFASSGTSAYFAGFPGRGACFCAAVLLSMSELSLLLISQGISAGILPSSLLGSFALAIIATAFVSAWLIDRENEIYNSLQSLVPQLFVNNMRLLRSTMLGMRRAVSESSRYYNVVEMLPTISYKTDQLSVREQFVLTSKNSIILGAASAILYLCIFFSQNDGWRFLDSLFLFILIGFFFSSVLFLINVRSTSNSLLKMITRSNSGTKYFAAGHFITAVFFISLAAVYLWAQSFCPPSYSAFLLFPSLAFALLSLFSSFRLIAWGGKRL